MNMGSVDYLENDYPNLFKRRNKMMQQGRVVDGGAVTEAGAAAKPGAPENITQMIQVLGERAHDLNDLLRIRLSPITMPRPMVEQDKQPLEVIPDYYEELREKIMFVDHNLAMIENWIQIAEIPAGSGKEI